MCTHLLFKYFLTTGPNFGFDRDIIHHDISIEDEGKVLTNTDRLRTKTDEQMTKFRGIRGTMRIAQDRSTVLQIAIMVAMKKQAKEKETLGQIGLTSLQKLNVREQFYVISVSECFEKKICLVVKKKNVAHRKYVVSNNYHDASFSGMISIIVSPQSRNIKYVFSGNSTRTEIIHILDVDFSGQVLWPVYGVFDPATAIIAMSIVNSSQNDAMFQKTTCHENIYISSDERAISNKKLDDGFQSGYKTAKQIYRGAVGDMSFQRDQFDYNNKPYYFAMNITCDLNLRKFEVNEIIFEIGFGPKDLITKHSVMKHHGRSWSFHFSRCSNVLKLCLIFIDKGTAVKRIHDTSVQKEIDFSTVFGIKVDPNKQYIGVYNFNYDTSLSYEFHNVDFSSPLHPIFGMTDKGFAKMKLLTKDNVPNYNIFGYFGSSPMCDS